MHNWTLSIGLIVGGAALATMGVLRLVTRSFGAMPRGVAVLVVVAGLGVLAFGAALPRLAPSVARPEGAAGAMDLEPLTTAPPTEPVLRADLHGTVEDAAGEPVPGVRVVLSAGAEGSADAETDETDPDGSFAFEDVAIAGPVRIAATYDGAVFEPERVGALSEPIEIRVARTTDSTDELSIVASSLAIAGDRDGVQAVQALTVRNDGDRAFAGELRLPVLAGAASLQPGLGLSRSRLAVERGSLVSTRPLLPGRTQLTYTYAVPATPSGVDVRTRASLDVDRLDVLVGGELRPGDRTSGARTERTSVGGRPYERLSWRDVDEGETVRLRAELPGDNDWVRIALLALAAAVAVAVVLMPVLRRRRADARR